MLASSIRARVPLLSAVRHYATASGLGPASYSRLVRFIDQSGTARVGEPIGGQDGAPIESAKEFESGKEFKIAKFLPPVNPPNIVCIGLNYKDHAAEVKMDLPRFPVIFTKTTNTVIGHNEKVVLPSVGVDECDYEAELAVVIGKPCKNATPSNALEHVYGYTIANDVTARKWQGKKGGGQWVRSKCFDTFCPLGPVMVSPQAVGHPNKLAIRTVVNGTTLQDSNTENMIFHVADIVAFVSQDTTLLPGTVILTGTPAGVGFTRKPPVILRAGDIVSVSIENIGTLTNTVVG
eukprot:comp23740_c0_seq1/m.40972 comp23740_c0_seq1/g.40972  ORF comp23740_c0_seq1/g.40972 comp23740_c0_seq1/m.40972 type:complete len:292 (-) comp23740_c0_seq1:411-1286(-)